MEFTAFTRKAATVLLLATVLFATAACENLTPVEAGSNQSTTAINTTIETEDESTNTGTEAADTRDADGNSATTDDAPQPVSIDAPCH